MNDCFWVSQSLATYWRQEITRLKAEGDIDQLSHLRTMAFGAQLATEFEMFRSVSEEATQAISDVIQGVVDEDLEQ